MGDILGTNGYIDRLILTMDHHDSFLGRYMKVKLKGLTKNGNLYRLKIRIPKPLLPLYEGQTHLQQALKTDDLAIATKRALVVIAKWEKEFKENLARLKKQAGIANALIPPESTLEALRKQWNGAEEFLTDELQDRYYKKIEGMAGGYGDEAERMDREGEVDPLSVVSPAELAYLREREIIKGGHRLSDALRTYLKTYEKDASKVENISTLAITSFIESIGSDLHLDKLKRMHLTQWVADCLKKGHKTKTVERRLHSIKAILNVAEAELETPLEHVIKKITIPNLGHDSMRRYSPTIADTKKLLEVFKDDPLVTLVILLGGRISEVSGLKMEDVKLVDEETPYLAIRPNEVRSLKTDNSKREFPLIGKALEAATKLVADGDQDREALLPTYYKARGGDALSSAINYKLAKKGYPHITTHCFRHGFKDLVLREVWV